MKNEKIQLMKPENSKNVDKSKCTFCINIFFFRQLGMPFARLDLASLLLA